MKHNKILITGNGTVGSNLDFGQRISSKDVDLRKKETTFAYIRKYSPNAIVHTAAKVGGLKTHIEERYKLLHNNLEINTNLIDAARKNNVPRVLSFLSSCIFSDISNPPYHETQIHDGEPFSVHAPYGHSKRILEVQSRICYEQFGLKYNCVIPVNIYGINDDFNLETGHVVGVLVHKAYLAAKNQTKFTVWGDGSQERNFLFTDDMAKLTEWALYNYLDKEPLILCDNTSVKVSDLAYLIAKEFNIENQIVFDKFGLTGQAQRLVTGDKLKSLTNFRFTPIENGIKQTVKYFVGNYPNIRL